MSQQESSNWYRINSILRIVMIIILLFIAYRVVYYKYGYKSFEDQKLLRDIGYGSQEVIDCRGALIYYAEKELMIINKTQARKIAEQNNITYIANFINTSNQ